MSNEPNPDLARKLNNAAIVAFAIVAIALLIVFSVSSHQGLRAALGILIFVAGLALMITTFWVMVLQAERRHLRRTRTKQDTREVPQGEQLTKPSPSNRNPESDDR